MMNCNYNRLAYIKQLLNNELESNDIGFIVIDDTVNQKNIRTKSMEALDFHYSHSLGRACWSHCVITSHFADLTQYHCNLNPITGRKNVKNLRYLLK